MSRTNEWSLAGSCAWPRGDEPKGYLISHFTHVIEYSAYTELKAQLEALGIAHLEALGAEWKEREKLWTEMMDRQTAATEAVTMERNEGAAELDTFKKDCAYIHSCDEQELTAERAKSARLVEALKEIVPLDPNHPITKLICMALTAHADKGSEV